MLYRTQNPHGGAVDPEKDQIDFSASTNPFGPPDFVMAALQDSLKRIHQYPDPNCRKMIRAVSEYEEVPEEWILPGNGAAELIFSFCSALHPRTALIPIPAFSEYETAVRNHGGSVIWHQLHQDNGFRLTENFLSDIECLSPDVVFLCEPNNPTGRLTERDLLLKIAELCREKGSFLFADECFLEFTDAADILKSRFSRYPNLVILKAFTKTYALAGLRVGYLLNSDPALLQRISGTTQPWNLSVPAQAAAVSIRKEYGYMPRTRELIRAERSNLVEALKNLGFFVCPSDANFLLFHAFPGLDKALREENIIIRSCGNFPGLGEGWYRIAVRQHEENDRLIRALTNIPKPPVM